MSLNPGIDIWPEDSLPVKAMEYGQCEVCTKRSRIIWGEGNPKAPIVIILDNPGAREDYEGQEYICGTRQTLYKIIRQVNLNPVNFYLTYLLKCRPLGSYDKEKAREFSKPYLIQQIQAINPKFLVCLGDVVLQSLLNNPQAHVKDLRGTWQTILGYPTIISYHPLAVRRRPNLKTIFLKDWEMLALRFLKEFHKKEIL